MASDKKRTECGYKLKERLHQLVGNKKDKKVAMGVLNAVGRADGERGSWRPGAPKPGMKLRCTDAVE